MGELVKGNIATVKGLKQISLAHNPHFVEISSTREETSTPKAIYTFCFQNFTKTTSSAVKIRIEEKVTQQIHAIDGTIQTNKVNQNTFFLNHTNASVCAENLRSCLLKNPFFRGNFEMIVPIKKSSLSTSSLLLIPKRIDENLNLKIQIDQTDAGFFDIKPTTPNPSFDSISFGTQRCNIELDIYTNTGVFLGEGSNLTEQNRGKYLTTLSKSYHRNKLWFDLNTLFSKKTEHSNSFLHAKGWCDTGSVNDFRFILKRNDGINNEIIFVSEVLYAVNGYDYTLHENSLDAYCFDAVKPQTSKIKTLTNNTAQSHLRGQNHYFNFILRDETHAFEMASDTLTESLIGIKYKFYTQSGTFIAQSFAHEQGQRKLNVMNTVELDLDTLIEQQNRESTQTVGKVEAMLCCNKVEVSESLTFNILPDSLHTVNDFAFLNRLGGWETFNFGNTASKEFKTTTNTFHKTLQPNYATHDRIESLASKSVSEQMTLQSTAISSSTAEWLREMSASPAVYELSSKRYVIVDQFDLKYNSHDDLFQVEMKYHYSDSFNSTINTSKKD